MTWERLGFALAITVGMARAQTTTTARPEFAVTSVKPNHTGCCTTWGAGNRGGGGGGKNVTLKELMGFAYRLQQFQISGGPRWIGSDRFDIEGKAEDPNIDFDRVRLMLQSLFEDRFKLKVHRETKQSAVYALVVGKGGSKIKLSRDQSPENVDGPSPPGAGPNHGAIRIGVGNLVGNAVTLSWFATMLSQRLDRLIVDKTSLTGRFDIRLQWTPNAGEYPFDPGGNRLPTSIIDMNGTTVTLDPSGPSIFSAIQEQLGLRLESAKAPVDVLVIDRVERPSEN
ncbi:MAG: TIGR03435 family protein [Acidobacteriia bacterium]|nr:TIGR03435 family protein [Terriglobia bacterium]